mgnify:CR=1 FL=1
MRGGFWEKGYFRVSKKVYFFDTKTPLGPFLKFLKFSNIVNNVGLKTKDISSFYFFHSGRWDIKFKDGLLLKLPNTDLINVLSKAMLLKNNQNFSNSKIIDLRIKNRIISNGW